MNLGKFKLSKTGNIGVIGDTHIPFQHPSYLEFCKEVFREFKVSDVVHIGDEVDLHALSFHDTDPDGLSPGDEANAAKAELKKWFKAFPTVRVCIGNHSYRHLRRAYKCGLPAYYLRNFNEIWEAPAGWRWEMRWQLKGVLFTHGTGSGGKWAHEHQAIKNRQSTAIGHIHSHGGVKYLANSQNMIWGMNVGCGVDNDSYAMAYGKDFVDKPTLGCGVILNDGRVPLFIPMEK